MNTESCLIASLLPDRCKVIVSLELFIVFAHDQRHLSDRFTLKPLLTGWLRRGSTWNGGGSWAKDKTCGDDFDERLIKIALILGNVMFEVVPFWRGESATDHRHHAVMVGTDLYVGWVAQIQFSIDFPCLLVSCNDLVQYKWSSAQKRTGLTPKAETASKFKRMAKHTTTSPTNYVW